MKLSKQVKKELEQLARDLNLSEEELIKMLVNEKKEYIDGMNQLAE